MAVKRRILQNALSTGHDWPKQKVDTSYWFRKIVLGSLDTIVNEITVKLLRRSSIIIVTFQHVPLYM